MQAESKCPIIGNSGLDWLGWRFCHCREPTCDHWVVHHFLILSPSGELQRECGAVDLGVVVWHCLPTVPFVGTVGAQHQELAPAAQIKKSARARRIGAALAHTLDADIQLHRCPISALTGATIPSAAPNPLAHFNIELHSTRSHAQQMLTAHTNATTLSR